MKNKIATSPGHAIRRARLPATCNHRCIALATLALVHAVTLPLGAATITVNNTSDSGRGTLRQAIQNASSGDTINFSVTGVITLTSGELLVARNLSIVGPGAASLAVSGHTNSRVFEIGSNVTVSISGLTIRDGHAPDGVPSRKSGVNGGGIYNAGDLALTGCAVISNTAGNGFSLPSQPTTPGSTNATGGAGGHGGGIYNSGTLRLASCTVSSNTGGRGGRSWNSFASNVGGAGGLGGGLYNAGTSTLTDCTLSGNTGGVGGVGGFHLTFSHGFPSAGGTGGAGGGAYNAGVLTLIACTLGSNSAGAGGTGASGGQTGGTGGAGGSGGAIYNATNATAATLHNSLAAPNQAGAGGTGGTGSVNAGAPGTAGTGSDLCGTFTSQGHNLVGQADGSTGVTNGVNSDLAGSTAAPLNPLLCPLQNNGGTTLTMALLAGSPALDAGDDALLGPPFNISTDQRGLPRKSAAHVDIGAFESQTVLQATQAQSQIMTVTSLPNGQFRFAVVTAPGITGRIEASSDLQNWTTLTNFTSAADGTYKFTDRSALNLPQRFYRVVAP